MSVLSDATRALAAAVSAVPTVRGYAELSPDADPPAVVVGPPRLTFEGFGNDPSAVEFIAYLVVPRDDRAIERLYDLLPQVVAAINSTDDFTVTSAEPGGFNELPAYELTITATP